MRASIITPTLNAAGFIEDCVANVAQQGEVVLEHLIVDGGSTDGTTEKVEELKQRFPKLVLLSGPDRGQSDALNKGSLLAAGNFIGILNADDYYQPGAVISAASELSAMTRPGVIVGDCRVLGEDDRILYWNKPRDLRLESLLLGWQYAQPPVNPSAYFYHKDVHRIVGGYDLDDHYGMDLDFLLKCAAKVKMKYKREHWGNFRLIPGSKTFEDEFRATRAEGIIDQHRLALNSVQRFMISSRRTQKRVKRRLGHILRQAGFAV